MKPPKFFLLLVCSLILLFVGSHLHAQKRVSFVQGKIRGALPYNELFLIVGETAQIDGVADAVQLQIYEENEGSMRKRQRLRKKNDPNRFQTEAYYSWTWEQVPGKDSSTSDSFEFYIDKPLKISTQYRLVFTFFKKFTPKSEVVLKIVREVEDAAVEVYRKETQVRVSDINNALDKSMRKYAQSLDFGQLQDQGDGSRSFVLGVTQAPKLPITAEDEESVGIQITRVVQATDQLTSIETNIGKVQAEVDRLVGLAIYDTAIVRLTNLLSTQVNPPISQADLNNLKEFAQTYTFRESPFSKLDEYAFPLTSSADAKEQEMGNLLLDLSSAAEDLQNLNRSRVEATNRKNTLSQDIEGGGLRQLILEGVVRTRSVEVLSVPGGGETSGSGGGTNARLSGSNVEDTGSRSIRIGSAYGVAIVGMNATRDVFDAAARQDLLGLDMMSYVGAKFFLQPVDKRFKNSYYNDRPSSKFSILAGAVVQGQLSYQGRVMGNPIGVKPILGLSYDFNRFVAVEGGAVFFDEPSLSPFNDLTRLRAAPFIGLSIDADAFNRVRFLLQGEKYSTSTDYSSQINNL